MENVAPGLVWRWPVAVTDAHIRATLATYLKRYPEEAAALAEPARLLRQGRDFAARRTFPMHVTVGALLVRDEAEVLLIEHRAYGLLLQPEGHLEPEDTTLVEAAMRELVEETGVEADAVSSLAQPPIYVEYGQVPARPDKDEPEHYHLDFGYAFTTVHAEIGRIQESEVTGAGWYPLPVAERLVGPRIARVVHALA
ncbi:NUDIX hydrolase [Nocardiopsis sp. CNS-639]|uniref:NUDIX hydrolase n=1 Tax=Nocardiopsis sp. CNS-639 TaxID=1169153 RepID=UPI001E3BB995|nr:NUDIX domain-containing protein [Nocardiopsis sp. CNS-639]